MLGLSSSSLTRGIAGGKSGRSRGSPKALLWFVGVSICLQIVYQFFMLGQLQETENSERRCDDGSCRRIEEEVLLFRSWKRIEVDGPEHFNETVENLERLAQQKLVEHMDTLTLAPTPSPQANGGAIISSVFIGEATPLVSFGTAEKIDRIYNDTVAILNNHSNITPFAQKLMDVKSNMQARMQRLPNYKKRRHQQWQEEFDKLYNDTLASIDGTTASDYVRKNEAMMEEIDARKANLPSEKQKRAAERRARLDKLYNDATAAIQDHSHSHDYADHLKAVRVKFESSPGFHHSSHAKSHDEIHKHDEEELASHNAAYEGELEHIHHDHKEWQAGFEDNAADYLSHMCAEPPRNEYPVCIKFLASQSDKVLAAKDASVASAATVQATTPPSNLRGASSFDDRLSWTKLLSSLKGSHRGSEKGLIAVDRTQLRDLKWQGRLPTVACIVAVSSGSDAKAQINHVIKNFRLQSYEGQRQLVFLYPHADAEIAELVREHSDGTFIKGLAAQNRGAFPSTTALRYAAWSTDADIIARWNFDEWYHADRLSMQVRALALSSRPVSLLKRWTVLGSEDATHGTVLSDDIGWENSIVGEAAWMKEHWMPLIYHERTALGGVQAHAIVQVDVPELLVYIMSDAGSWDGALRHFDLHHHTDAPLEVPEECTLPCADAGAGNVESAIIDKVGAELGDSYHALVEKKAQVAKNLCSLCEELSETHEPLQRDQMIGQVKHIAGLQQQLAQHFKAVTKLFQATSLAAADVDSGEM